MRTRRLEHPRGAGGAKASRLLTHDLNVWLRRYNQTPVLFVVLSYFHSNLCKWYLLTLEKLNNTDGIAEKIIETLTL